MARILSHKSFWVINESIMADKIVIAMMLDSVLVRIIFNDMSVGLQ